MARLFQASAKSGLRSMMRVKVSTAAGPSPRCICSIPARMSASISGSPERVHTCQTEFSASTRTASSGSVSAAISSGASSGRPSSPSQAAPWRRCSTSALVIWLSACSRVRGRRVWAAAAVASRPTARATAVSRFMRVRPARGRRPRRAWGRRGAWRPPPSSPRPRPRSRSRSSSTPSR